MQSSSLSLPTSLPSFFLPPNAKPGLALWTLKTCDLPKSKIIYFSVGKEGECGGNTSVDVLTSRILFWTGKVVDFYFLLQSFGCLFVPIKKDNITKSALPHQWREAGGDTDKLQ